MPPNIPQFVTIQAFKELGAFLGKKLDSLKDSFGLAIEKVSIKEDIKPLLQEISSLRQALSKVEKVANRPIQGNFKMDSSEIVRAIKVLEKKTGNADVKAELVKLREVLKPQAPDYSPIYKRIDESKTDNSDVVSALTRVEKVLSALAKKETKVKIDDMQMRALTSGGGATVVGGGGMITPNPTRVTVANVAMTVADTEYSYTFPNKTVSWQIRVRDVDQPLLVASVTGKLPTSGDGSAYFTVPAYYIQEVNGVDWSGKILYLQTAGATQVAEIISYQY